MCTGCLNTTNIHVCVGRYSISPVDGFLYQLNDKITQFNLLEGKLEGKEGALVSAKPQLICSIVSSSVPYGGDFCSSENSKRLIRGDCRFSNVNQYFYPSDGLPGLLKSINCGRLIAYMEKSYKEKLFNKGEIVKSHLISVCPLLSINDYRIINTVLSYDVHYYEL
jgi:hypothetical protein